MRPAPPSDSTRPALVLCAVHAVLVAVPVVVLAGLVHVAFGVVVGLVAGVGVTVWRYRDVDTRVGRRLGAREVTEDEQPRLTNLMESVSMAVGVAAPRVHVIDEAGRNGVAWGRHRERGNIAVTSSLLATMGRTELEALLANLATDLRDGATEVPTLACGLFGDRLATVTTALGSGLDDRRAVVSDLASAAAIRFPPAAVAALSKLATVSTAVERHPRALDALWLADPAGDPGHSERYPSFEDRIDLLREL